MGFWKRKQSDLEKTAHIIEANPGISPAELARRLGVSRSTIIRRLPSLEEAGYLLYEDQKGGLYKYHADRIKGEPLCNVVAQPTYFRKNSPFG